MRVHLYSICWNDARILPYFFRHYDSLVDRYVIYDDVTRIFEFRRVAYDIDSAANKIFEANLEPNFGNRLFIGV